MTDRESFMSRIIESPDDDTPRLVYADWLDEHGGRHSDQKQAEFIRIQIELATEDPRCERANMPFKACVNLTGLVSPDRRCDRCKRWANLHEREIELLKAGHAAWMPVVAGFSFIPRLSGEPLRENHVLYHRGFPDSVKLSWDKWLGCGDYLISEAPVANVELTTIPITVANFTGNVTRLRLQGRNRAFIEITLPSDLYLHGIPWLLSREWPAVKKFTFPMPELPIPMTEFLPLTTAAD